MVYAMSKCNNYILILFCLLATIAHAQMLDSAKVPQAIRTKLWHIYPKAVNIKWAYDCYVESTTKNGRITEKRLCFRASFPNKEKFEILYFDSTATWYRDDEEDLEPEDLINVPQKAIDKMITIYPSHKNIEWHYYTNFETIKGSKYDALYKDSTTYYHSCFDSNWNYTGTYIEFSGDTNTLLIHIVNTYIKENFKGSSFEFARIILDSDQNLKSVMVRLGIKERKYNTCTLVFDKNGNLIKKPWKFHVYPPDF